MKKPRRRRLPSGFWPVLPAGKNSLLAPAWLSLAAAVLAAMVMPQYSPFPYHFEKGHPWNYQTLKAPFDFEVLYPEEQVRKQLDSINTAHAPYFIVYPDVARVQKRRFTELVQEQARISRQDAQFEDLVRKPGAYIAFGQQLLDAIYLRGLGGPELDELLRNNPNAPLFVVKNNQEQRTIASALLTMRGATDFLSDTLPFSPLRQPELILTMLEKTLTPNVIYSDSLTTTAKRRKIAAVVSTGISVRKGETIVKKTDLVNDDIFLKLNSLSRRFDAPKSILVVSGYALLALLTFGFFFFWLYQEHAYLWENSEYLVLLPTVMLVLILFVNLTGWLGAAVPLILPLWGTPLILRNKYSAGVGKAVWVVVLLLTTFASDWPGGWLALQLAGIASAELLFNPTSSWRAKALSALATTALQTVAWLAGMLAGKIPAALQSADTILFLLAGNCLLMLLFPFGQIFFGNMGNSKESSRL